MASEEADILNPTDLPEVVTERIFTFLLAEDLLKCCLVNSRWRDATNKNIIWRRHCKLPIKYESVACKVSPAFIVPTSDCEDLTPLCRYRIHYMRQIHLLNNFRHNRCVEYKLSRTYNDKIEFLDKYLILNDTYKNVFHVWDIEDSPVRVQTVPYLLNHMCTQAFQIVGDFLLIVQCNLLQLYSVTDGNVSLKLCRIFDQEEKFSETIPSIDTISSWYASTIKLYPCDFTSLIETVGDYFIGIVEPANLNQSVMHIWDLKSGNKLKEDRFPPMETAIENICCGKNSEFLYIALYTSVRNERCKIFCYSLKTLDYTQFYVESEHSIPFMLFEENVVVLPCDQWEKSGSYTFLDAVTGNKIVEKKFDNPINPKALDIHGILLVYGSSNTVTVVDLSTQEEVLVFPVDFEVVEVCLLDHNMLLVGGVDYHFVLEVWDIKKNTKLYRMDERSILLCGTSLRRLAFQNLYSIHILHYW